MDNNKNAVIAMSGGVDSAVAAYLMHNMGYKCIGATMKLHYNNENSNDFHQSCCSDNDIKDAKKIADMLGIPYFVYDFEDDFKEKVIDKFVSVYEQGGTPNPCIDCNRYLKFEKLFEKMTELNFDFVVTGHYARIFEKDGWFYLKKGLDETKDQSYVLYSLTQYHLSHTKFPLGEYSKTEIRKIAEKENFINAHKKDSQDICFVPDGDYASFIEQYTGKTYPNGNFVDLQGNIIGRHNGIIRYTVGQRKGLGVSFGKPMYVLSKNIADNTVTLCDNFQLMSTGVVADDFNWLIPNPEREFNCSAKIRYNMKEQEATVKILDDESVEACFKNPVRAVAKGQSLVLYKDDFVLGGGTIL